MREALHPQQGEAIKNFTSARSAPRGRPTTNASAELAACNDQLRIPHVPCSCHSLALVLKAALSVPERAAMPDIPATNVPRRAGPGRSAGRPHAAPRRPGQCGALLQEGEGQVGADARAAGVQIPLCLISRSNTRWTESGFMLVHAMLLRRWLDTSFVYCGITVFNDILWRVLYQARISGAGF